MEGEEGGREQNTPHRRRHLAAPHQYLNVTVHWSSVGVSRWLEVEPLAIEDPGTF